MDTAVTDRLRREWATWALAGIAVLSGTAYLRPPSLPASFAVWAWCCLQLYRALPENHRRGETAILPGLGPPNRLTLLRGLLIAAAAGFLLEPWVSAPAYSLAALLDRVDGRLARARGRETALGTKLDMEVDAAGVLVATASGIAAGKLPHWYLAIGLARYVFAGGILWRKLAGRPANELDPLPIRRLLAGVQMGFLAVALWPPIPASASRAAAYGFGLATLLMFVRDWRFVSSRKRSIRTIDSPHPG